MIAAGYVRKPDEFQVINLEFLIDADADIGGELIGFKLDFAAIGVFAVNIQMGLNGDILTVGMQHHLVRFQVRHAVVRIDFAFGFYVPQPGFLPQQQKIGLAVFGCANDAAMRGAVEAVVIVRQDDGVAVPGGANRAVPAGAPKYSGTNTEEQNDGEDDCNGLFHERDLL